MNKITPGKYKHFKGGVYEVLFIAQHSETKREMVVYKSLEDNKHWVREVKSFTAEMLTFGNGFIPRFKRIP